MTVIAVKGVPTRWSLQRLVVTLAKSLKEHYEPLNFLPGRGPSKIAYFRLPPSVDPLAAIDDINHANIKNANLTAFLPDDVPDLPVGAKNVKIPLRVQKKHKIVVPVPPNKLLPDTHREILTELRAKYTGLPNLNKKTNNKLMTEISKIVLDRLKYLLEINTGEALSGYTFSKLYRRSHPHFADFQLILSTLHRIEDAEGSSRTQVSESELCSIDMGMFSNTINPMDKVQTTCNKYANKITSKITSHINGLKAELDPGLPPEQAEARAKVRDALLKLNPFIGSIVSQVVMNNLNPLSSSNKHTKLRIYGEPFLPNKEMLGPVLAKFHPVKVIRSQHIFNMIRLDVPSRFVTGLLQLDGYEVAGAKLVIRLSDHSSLMKADRATKTVYKLEGPQETVMDEGDMEDWTEEM